jgi:hypothetical protein
MHTQIGDLEKFIDFLKGNNDFLENFPFDKHQF